MTKKKGAKFLSKYLFTKYSYENASLFDHLNWSTSPFVYRSAPSQIRLSSQSSKKVNFYRIMYKILDKYFNFLRFLKIFRGFFKFSYFAFFPRKLTK